MKDLTQLTDKELKERIPEQECGRATAHNELLRRSIEKLNKSTTIFSWILIALAIMSIFISLRSQMCIK
jgi:hypothetical protein